VKNKVSQLLSEGKPAVGTFLVSRCQSNLEVIASAGYDFAVVDAEHFMVNPETIEHLVTAGEAAGFPTLVRVQENIHLIQRVLDCGAAGIVAPMVDTAQQAREVVDTAKYAPIGRRGVCNPRSVLYAAKGAEYMVQCYAEQNDQQLVIVQAETVASLENLPEIVKVKGIDCLFVGPWDLANSLGIRGETDNPRLEEKIAEALGICKQEGIPAGILAWNGEDAARRIQQGFQFIICSGDMLMLASAAQGELAAARGT
jgi:2-keto-3-deoxy-L-rhamnonate aldolase RhmA